MKNILLLGGSGMLGHKLYQVLSNEFNVKVTFRKFNKSFNTTSMFRPPDIVDNIDALDFESIQRTFFNFRPDIIINCIGIIKQLKQAQNYKLTIYINSLFPHLLAELCQQNGSRLIHISTDCVFSGHGGTYTESSKSDAEDLYGRSKFLGEASYSPALTLRTSIIGHELISNISLVDWFISNMHGIISGYDRAIYTGFPTITLASEILRIINNYPELTGLYNVSSEPISKYELLKIINEVYSLKIKITKDEEFYCDRSLDSTKYRLETGFRPNSWPDMIKEMFEDYLKIKYKKQEIK